MSSVRPSDVGLASAQFRDLMHATRYPHPFTADGWVFENKLDGFRALARKSGATPQLFTSP